MNDNLKRAIALHRNGQIDKAEILYLDLLKKDENNSSILQLLGTVYLQKKNYKLSERYFLKSLNIDPNNPATINNLGILNKQNKKLDKAINYFDINIKKNNFLNSWVNKSNILIENKRFEEGLQFSKNALKKYPQDVKLRNNFAIFLFKCGFQNEALKIYQQFDEENLHFEDSFYNYSNILIQINDLSKALLITNKLILNNKKNLNGLHQRHLIYKLLFDFTNAEIDILNSIKIDKLNFISNKMLVELYIDYKKFDKALYYCELMIRNKIEEEFFGIKKILCKINLGIWQNLKQELEVFNKNFKYDSNSINPLSLKYINDDPLIQKKFSENYWKSKIKNPFLFNISSNVIRNKTSKIRIGYFSGDFTNHAVFHLIQDLFLNHDKSKFEIYAYSTFKKESSAREKIIKNVDYFYDIDKTSDEEIIKLVKSHSLDIAIDLSGYTVHNRSHLFEYNIAKIKINYLGYPGTMGTKSYDYIIADKNIIPENQTKFYSENVIYLPEIYQPFSPIDFDLNVKRSAFGLPEDVFLFGSFSRIEKILPDVFNIWMNILKKYKDTYLALCINNQMIKNNIKEYCDENNFNFNNIIFLNSIEHLENLKRISTFDLYLDTYPYNGHTGISDSLFQSCVPTISLTGNSFASRVSYSLLNSLNLKNLVTYTTEEYAKKIEYYTSNKNELKKIRQDLINFKKKI